MAAGSVFVIRKMGNDLGQLAISEVVEAIEQLDIVEKKPDAVTGHCIVQ